MRRDWPAAAVAFEESVAKALRSGGGVGLARAAETDRSRRSAPADLLSLDPWGDEEESAAVVLGLRAAGAVVAPFPVTHVMAVPLRSRAEIGGVYLASGTARRLDHADLFPTSLAIDVADGSVYDVTPGASRHAPLDPFGTLVTLEPSTVDLDVPSVVAWHLLLDAFWVTGALATAADLTVAHANEREQFGRKIGKFGEIRWRIADIAVAVDGLAELALHAWWLLRRRAAGPADLLALRVHMLETADIVLANGHQVLGAMGLCEEHDLAVIDRHLQPVLHRPAGRIVSTDLLAKAVARDGFDGIYPVRSWT